MRETWVWSLGWEDPLEKENATHSSILAWRIAWTVLLIGSQRVGRDWVTFTFTSFHFTWMLCVVSLYHVPKHLALPGTKVGPVQRDLCGFRPSLLGPYKNGRGSLAMCSIHRKWKSLSRVRLFATPRTVQSVEFSRPEYWGGYPFPSPGDLPNSGIKPRSPALQVDPLPAEPQGKAQHTQNIKLNNLNHLN